MKKLDEFEKDILDAYENGDLISSKPSAMEKEKYKVAAQATFLKDRRVNIRISSPDLMDKQARALEDGVPYQTLIASVLHKYVSGRLVETPSRLTTRSTGRTKKTAHRLVPKP
jgi:predicted DNA binding CopG/RHH family protein